MKKTPIRNIDNRLDDLRFTSVEFGTTSPKASLSKNSEKSPVAYPLFFTPIYKQALWGGGMQNFRNHTEMCFFALRYYGKVYSL